MQRSQWAVRSVSQTRLPCLWPDKSRGDVWGKAPRTALKGCSIPQGKSKFPRENLQISTWKFGPLTKSSCKARLFGLTPRGGPASFLFPIRNGPGSAVAPL